MKRIGVPMIGGMLSSTVLTLLVVPAIWSLMQERRLAWTAGGSEDSNRSSEPPAWSLPDGAPST